jgi:hypothetical protein
MFHTLTFVDAQWANLYKLIDLAPGVSEKPLEKTGGHILHTSGPDEKWKGMSFVVPGDVDCREPDPRILYARRRPFPPAKEIQTPEDAELIDHWRNQCRDAPRSDNYLVLSLSMPTAAPRQTNDIHCGAFYGPHLFIWGEDEEGEPLSRGIILRHLKTLGVRAHPDFWDPVTIWRGYDGGYPTWDTALRNHTDLGPRWTEVQHKLSNNDLPEGYQWDSYQPHRGMIYFDKEEMA